MIPTRSPSKHVVGMIHVGALPGTPHSRLALPAILEQACAEAALYDRCGVDGLLIENMHDRPYLNGIVGPEIVAAMTAVGIAVRRAVSRPLGVQILAAANREALAVALACGADYIRVENFVFSHVADEGLMPTAEAGPLLRFRKQIDAEHVGILADVKKKHSSHAITSDVSLEETSRAAEFFGADGLIVTGMATGRPTSPDDVRIVRAAVDLPVWIGSGVTAESLAALWPHADGFIVGSSLKRNGLWSEPVEAERVKRLVDEVGRLRGAGAA